MASKPQSQAGFTETESSAPVSVLFRQIVKATADCLNNCFHVDTVARGESRTASQQDDMDML